MSVQMAGAEPYNACLDLLERNAGEGRAERTYLIADRDHTYGEVIGRVRVFAAGLLGLGLQRGDRVVIVADESPTWVCAFWGALRAGLVPVPTAPILTPGEVEFIVHDSGARAVVYDAGAERLLRAIDLRGAVPIAIGATAVAGARPFAEIVGDVERLCAVTTSGDDLACALYTSGTTGPPKAVLHRHASFRAAPSVYAGSAMAMGRDDRSLSVARIFFAYGLAASVYLPAAAGAASILHAGERGPLAIQATIDRHAPTMLFAGASFYVAYLRTPGVALVQSIRAALSSGEPLPAPIGEEFATRFGLPLLDGMGATETLGHFTCTGADDVVPGSAGRPLAGWEVQVRDPDGSVLPNGRSGELFVRGPTVLVGYWNRPELTAQRLIDGWLRTGDLVRVRDGRLYALGRVDDLLKLGGTWVAPREIEDVLRTHADVEDAVVGLSLSPSGVPLLKAFLRSSRSDPGLAIELQQRCAQQLASFKVPRVFETVSEFPRTATGKVKRFELRAVRAEPYVARPGMVVVMFEPGVAPHDPRVEALLRYASRYRDVRAEVREGVPTEVQLSGRTEQLSRVTMEQLPGIKRVVTLSEKHRLLGRYGDEAGAGFVYRGERFDQDSFHVFAGLCAVDTREHVEATMRALQRLGVTTTRMGAYKPRTSPYDFQGLEVECLPYVFELAGKYGIRVIAMEVLHERHVAEIRAALAQAGDPTGVMLQIGTRNAQNFELLKCVGQHEFPILYKRGMGVTIEESLSACEYIASSGQRDIVFCLRGVKTHLADPHRNLVDFAQVPIIKRRTVMPVCIDPSHSVGRKDRGPDHLTDVAHATALGVIAGANMVLVDVHPAPERALCDGPQALRLDELAPYLEDVQIVRDAYQKRRAAARRATPA